MISKIIRTVSFLLLINLEVSANVLWNYSGSTPPRHRNVTREDQAPCGLTTRSFSTEIPGGRSVEVSWIEIIPQEGRFEIYFSESGDSNWVLLKTIENQPQDFSKTLVKHKTQVLMPNKNCEACTLQIVQVITTAVQAKYYSCADIKLNLNLKEEPSAPTPTACQ